MKKTLIAASFGLAFFLPQAEAALFDFSYAAPGLGTYAGTVDGTLQSDHNTVVVNSVLDFVTFDGSAEPALPFVWSYDKMLGFGTGSQLPTLTLDGSYLDFLACASSTGTSCPSFNSQLFFSVGATGFVDMTGTPTFGTSALPYGNTPNVTFQPAGWHMSAQSSVPVPATLPLLAIGGAVMAWRRRKAA